MSRMATPGMVAAVKRCRATAIALCVAVAVTGASGCARNPQAAAVSSPGSSTSRDALPARTSPSTATLRPAPSALPRTVGSSPATAEAGTYTPKQLGPGVVLEPNLRTAPVVPVKTTVSQYVSGYYTALLAKKWDRAMRMIPSENPRGSVKEFRDRSHGYETAQFRVVTAGETKGVGAALVAVTTPDNGVWNVTWEFATTNRGLVVATLKYGRVGQNGCH